MAAYVNYTLKRTVAFPVMFKCENCGKINIVSHPFHIETHYNDKGTVTKEGLEKREEKAMQRLDEKQAELFSILERETKNKNFQDVEYFCVCQNCGHKPKWSFFKNILLEIACKIVLFLAACISVIFFLVAAEVGDSSAFSILLIPLGMLALVYIPRFVLYNSKYEQIAKMSEEHMPIIFEDEQTLYTVLAKLDNKSAGSTE